MAQTNIPAVIVPSRVVLVSSSPDFASQGETQTATISFDPDLQRDGKAEAVEMDVVNVAKQPVYHFPDRGSANGRSVSFHDVCYEVPQRKCFVRKPNKMILKSVRFVRSHRADRDCLLYLIHICDMLAIRWIRYKSRSTCIHPPFRQTATPN